VAALGDHFVNRVHMPFLSSWAVRKPVMALIAWVISMVAVFGVAAGLAGELNDSFDLPNTESKTATDLLVANDTDTAGFEGGGTIVWSPAAGSAVDPVVLAQVTPVLERIAALEAALRDVLKAQTMTLGPRTAEIIRMAEEVLSGNPPLPEGK
jgi:hypothetical protein